MAHFVVETTAEEQKTVMEVLKEVQGQTIPVSKIASMAKLSTSRTRYVLIDLIDAGKVERVATKAFNKHYVRYSYKIL